MFNTAEGERSSRSNVSPSRKAKKKSKRRNWQQMMLRPKLDADASTVFGQKWLFFFGNVGWICGCSMMKVAVIIAVVMAAASKISICFLRILNFSSSGQTRILVLNWT